MKHDIFSDMLVRLKNAVYSHKSSVIVPYSKLNASFGQILIEENMLVGVKKLSKGLLLLEGLKMYSSSNETNGIKKNRKYTFLKECKRISKSSNRIYISASNIPLVDNGLGLLILSTSAGLMTGKKARSLNLGGEVFCNIAFTLPYLYAKQ